MGHGTISALRLHRRFRLIPALPPKPSLEARAILSLIRPLEERYSAAAVAGVVGGGRGGRDGPVTMLPSLPESFW